MGARRVVAGLVSGGRSAAGSARTRLTSALGGAARTRVILVLACVLGLSSADVATVGASATELRQALGISNTDIGLLVTVTSLVAAAASLPFGVLADRMRRTWTLGAAIALWGGAMIWSAAAANFGELLLARVVLGIVTAAAGPLVASLVGDYFPGSERGRVYGYILAGELVGAGLGFGVTGDVAALSWRAAFVVLAVPAFLLAWAVARLPEPARGGRGALLSDGAAADGQPNGDSLGEEGAGAGHRPRAGPGEAAGGGDGLGGATDAQRLAAERGVSPDPALVLRTDPRWLSLPAAARYVLRVRTNLVLIIASACGYYFLAGVETFGTEFAKDQYGVNQAVANLVLLGIGVGAVGGVLAGGAVGDALLHRRRLNARILTSAVAVTVTIALFVPALLTRDLITALPYLIATAFFLAAQNPPLDAARLDIMPPRLWGRAESVRTVLRSLAQALAPVLFGVVADNVFGGGRAGLQWTFAVMLVPLAASAFLLYRALRTYPRDVATAAASGSRSRRQRQRPATPRQ